MITPAESRPRFRCGLAGVVPLTGRLEPWQISLLEGQTELADLVERYGSPVNLLDPGPMRRNAGELAQVAERLGVDLRIHFARKANKALTFVDEAHRLGLGIDLASEIELEQAPRRGITGEDLIMTAAVKPEALLTQCLRSGTTVAIDNQDELDLLRSLSAALDLDGPIALRLAPDLGAGERQTRFGLDSAAWLQALDDSPAGSRLAVDGVHFHLDGYRVADRIVAIDQALELIAALRSRNHPVRFLDIGGGVPMSYLEDGAQWDRFWVEHRDALRGGRDELTFDGQEISKVYPYHQSPVRGAWLEQVLLARLTGGSTVAQELRANHLQLRCEPGRSLLDGCGMTVARVQFRKQRRDGTWFVGLAMNRTQCRSTSDDFLVDPLLVRAPGSPTDLEIEGYLVGAYCIELELLSWRRMRFPTGVAVGDLIAFPNTAGYLMHILESTSHQIPLARNVVVSGSDPRLDDIDG